MPNMLYRMFSITIYWYIAYLFDAKLLQKPLIRNERSQYNK